MTFKKNGAVPRHIAVIMDGNGRWAKRRLLPRIAGHKQGVESLRRCARACVERGVQVLTVPTLAEIQDVSGRPMLSITQQSLFKLLRALNECTEWGQVFILDSLSSYEAADAKDAESIVERVTPRLQHANIPRAPGSATSAGEIKWIGLIGVERSVVL